MNFAGEVQTNCAPFLSIYLSKLLDLLAEHTLLPFPIEFQHFLVRVTTCSSVWSIIDTVGQNKPTLFQRIPASSTPTSATISYQVF